MTELLSGMPVLPLTANMTVRFEAVSPTTGLPVAGVLVSNAVLYATDAHAENEPLGDIGPMMFVPGPTPVENVGTTSTGTSTVDPHFGGH